MYLALRRQLNIIVQVFQPPSVSGRVHRTGGLLGSFSILTGRRDAYNAILFVTAHILVRIDIVGIVHHHHDIAASATADQSAVVLNKDEQAQNGTANNDGTHQEKGALVRELSEAQRKGHGTNVATCAHNAADAAGHLGIDIRDDAAVE